MKIEIDLSEFAETLRRNWGWCVGAAICCWYFLASFVVKEYFKRKRMREFVGEEAPLIIYIASPIIAVAAIFAVPLWIVSGGLVRPPWKW